MPEGPEVTVMMRLLRNQILNKNIKFTMIKNSTKFKTIPSTIDIHAIFPLQVIDVSNNGKLSYITFADGNNVSKKYYLTQTYGLKGGWYKAHNDSSRFCLELDDNTKFYYNDSSNYGSQLFTSDKCEFDKKMTSRGLDLQKVTDSDSFTSELSKLIERKIEWNICKFLMEQKLLSGIGNYLKCEILYNARISPFRKLKDLSSKDIRQLSISIIDVYNEALNANGRTFKYSDLISKEECTFIFNVYEKKIDQNGLTIFCEKTPDNRKTYYRGE